MAKYSTGGGDGDEDGACELCGAPADNLHEATIAGARLAVCPSCAPHDDTAQRRTQSGDTPDAAASDAADQAADPEPQTSGRAQRGRDTSPLWNSDTSHWEEDGVSYAADRLPYLVADYGDRVQAAREAAGMTRGELAADLDILEHDLVAVEQGNAATAGVGGSTITALEDALDVTLTE